MSYVLNRRALLAALAASPAALAGPKAPVRATIGGYTALTAPDKAAQAVLARKLLRLDQGRLPGQPLVDAIRANTQQLIEQSIARLDPARIPRFTGLPANHKRAIAQLYVNATGNSPRPPMLYDIMATRLTGAELAEHAQYFGYVPLYMATARIAPEKLRTFEAGASTASIGPVYGGKTVAPNVGLLEILDMTLGDIWILLRLAPIGLYSVSASAFGFAALVGGALTAAWGFGFGFGSAVVVPVIQYVLPDLYPAIGDAIVDFVDRLESTPPSQQGPVQENGAGAGVFNLPEPLQDVIVDTGGDYQINEAWSDYSNSGGGGGGGGGGRCTDCQLI